jgi:hypothetical protein
MRIFINNRKVGKGCLGLYHENYAYFKKEDKKCELLHELFHHLVASRTSKRLKHRQYSKTILFGDI